jgi:hypothetical protein
MSATGDCDEAVLNAAQIVVDDVDPVLTRLTNHLSDLRAHLTAQGRLSESQKAALNEVLGDVATIREVLDASVAPPIPTIF